MESGAITSTANPRVKWLQSLRKRRVRDTEQVTVVEGRDDLRLALDAGVRPRLLVTCPALISDEVGGDETFRELCDRVRALGAEMVTMGRAAFAKASYRESPDGWLAVVPDPASDLESLTAVLERTVRARRPALVLVCEAVEKPGNLGAMLRTAEAAGADAVVAASPVADWGNPNVVRASKGTVFAVPIASAPSTETVIWLLERGLHIVVATPDADRLLGETDLTRPTALVVGAEHQGVSALWFDPATVGPDAVAARLPMAGKINSLNVATSAALALYEAVRQRG